MLTHAELETIIARLIIATDADIVDMYECELADAQDVRDNAVRTELFNAGVRGEAAIRAVVDAAIVRANRLR